MRPIDADELIKKFGTGKADTEEEKTFNMVARRIINEQPTVNDDWISVKDRVPDWMEDVLCIVVIPDKNGGFTQRCKVLHIDDTRGKGWNCEGMIVTHWTLLPASPKEVTLNA